MIDWTGTPWLDNLIVAFIIMIIAFIISTFLRRLIKRFLQRETRYLRVDETQYSFLKNAISSIVYGAAIIVVFYSIPQLKSLGATLFAGAGILAAILAFASQQAFSNIIGGIFIVVFKPFRVGDWVEVSKKYHGVIEDINLRHTVIRDFEYQRIIIPNSVISSETIINSQIEDKRIRKHVEVPVSYNSDIALAKKIMQEEYRKHPYYIDGRSQSEIDQGYSDAMVRVLGFEESGVVIRLYAWAKEPEKAWILATDLYQSIKERFEKEGVEMPFPYRNIVMKEPVHREEKNQ